MPQEAALVLKSLQVTRLGNIVTLIVWIIFLICLIHDINAGLLVPPWQ